MRDFAAVRRSKANGRFRRFVPFAKKDIGRETVSISLRLGRLADCQFEL